MALSSSSASSSRRRSRRVQSLRKGVARATRASRRSSAAPGRSSAGGRTSVSSEYGPASAGARAIDLQAALGEKGLCSPFRSVAGQAVEPGRGGQHLRGLERGGAVHPENRNHRPRSNPRPVPASPGRGRPERRRPAPSAPSSQRRRSAISRPLRWAAKAESAASKT